ncbi:MAG: S-adenosyl-l-methionine hydroxide adenosyltransferase family protein [Cytophagaceae bacterium]
MAIITFMSDFGHRDHYVAAVKAKIFNYNQTINIVDISHEIELFNIPHAAYVLKSVFRDFPKGTVHLAAVNAPSGQDEKPIAVKLEEHYFVGMDNGLFSLISEKPPTAIVELNRDSSYSRHFPAKTVLASAAVSLASGISIYNLGMQISSLRSMLNRQLRITKSMIAGHIIHVDKYGNLMTNITSDVFEKHAAGRNFTINFAREAIDNFSEGYDSSDNGDIVVLFNSNGVLEIAISQGNASELLGLGFDSPVSIHFVGE